MLEVLLATVILAMSIAALAQHVDTGVQAGLRSELEAEAALICQSKMNQILLQPSAAENVRETLAGDEWMCSITVDNTKHPDVRKVSVSVQHTQQPVIGRFQLTRLVRITDVPRSE